MSYLDKLPEHVLCVARSGVLRVHRRPGLRRRRRRELSARGSSDRGVADVLEDLRPRGRAGRIGRRARRTWWTATGEGAACVRRDCDRAGRGARRVLTRPEELARRGRAQRQPAGRGSPRFFANTGRSSQSSPPSATSSSSTSAAGAARSSSACSGKAGSPAARRLRSAEAISRQVGTPEENEILRCRAWTRPSLCVS